MNKKTFFDYEGFVEKFKPKKTTDDCYTPPEVYEVIKDWVCNRYGINPCTIVRPFYPSGDFENFNYPEGCLVLDNPPFSILAKIKRFYLEKEIKFFLFAPSLTLFSSPDLVKKICHIGVGADIVYENGAVVKTSFVTNLDKQYTVFTAPDLYKKIENINLNKKAKSLPKYSYPAEIITSAELQKMAFYGVSFQIPVSDCVFCGALESQKKRKKNIFGGGLLVSPKVAAEKIIAEKIIAEKIIAEKNKTIIWPLSEKEKNISQSLN